MKFLYFIIAILTVCNNGFSSVDLDPAEIQLLINSIQKNHHLPGVQASVKDAETGNSWDFSTGFRNRETSDPLETSHRMQIGSTTKSFIASLVLLLEAESESGLLGVTFNIEQTIEDWLPQYSKWGHIKIKNLLNMTSGIYNYTDDNSLFIDLLQNPNRIWQSNELVDLAYSQEPNILFQVGSKYSYSNTNYILAEMILEKVSGLPLETLINERILKKYPTHFKCTSYSPTTYPLDEMQNMACGYAMNPKNHSEFYGLDITSITLSWARGAGGLTSTASDLANWPTLLFSNDFLPKKQREELETLVGTDSSYDGACELPKDSKLMGYGLGIARFYDPDYGYIWTHTGGTLGYHALFVYLPEKSVVISVIVNQMGPQIDEENDVVFILQQIFDCITVL